MRAVVNGLFGSYHNGIILVIAHTVLINNTTLIYHHSYNKRAKGYHLLNFPYFTEYEYFQMSVKRCFQIDSNPIQELNVEKVKGTHLQVELREVISNCLLYWYFHKFKI